MNDIKRAGNFSSSAIYNLTSKGRGNFSIENVGSGFNTYIEEKAMERNLGRSLQTENSARPTAWGTLVEEQAFEKMGLKYSLVSQERFYHKKHSEYWNGMPDVITEAEVGDIKSPWTLKSFCSVIKNIEIFNETGDLEPFKKAHPSWYWQLISNAILCDKKKGLLIVYCPYLEDLEKIRKLASDRVGEGNNRFAFINWAEDSELPYLIKGNKYKDINMLQFDIPEEDVKILTERVEMAIKEIDKLTK